MQQRRPLSSEQHPQSEKNQPAGQPSSPAQSQAAQQVPQFVPAPSANGMTLFDNLSNDVKGLILQLCTLDQIIRLSRVSKGFRALVDNARIVAKASPAEKDVKRISLWSGHETRLAFVAECRKKAIQRMLPVIHLSHWRLNIPESMFKILCLGNHGLREQFMGVELVNAAIGVGVRTVTLDGHRMQMWGNAHMDKCQTYSSGMLRGAAVALLFVQDAAEFQQQARKFNGLDNELKNLAIIVAHPPGVEISRGELNVHGRIVLTPGMSIENVATLLFQRLQKLAGLYDSLPSEERQRLESAAQPVQAAVASSQSAVPYDPPASSDNAEGTQNSRGCTVQ